MIYITGDTHGIYDNWKLTSRNFPEGKKLTKQDYVIICGDFGGIWYGTQKDNYILKWYKDKPWTTLFVDGNHENHELLNAYPVTEMFGGKVHVINDSVIHLMRGQVYEIDGKTFFTMGGATSIDKEWRTEHISWWKEELPSFAEYEEAEKNLEKANWKVDYVLSHDCSRKMQYAIKDDVLGNGLGSQLMSDGLNEFFSEIEKKLEYKHWYFGHYHIDKEVDDRHTALYETITQLSGIELAVLLPIHKKYADMILNGEKLVEIRKTIPNLSLPFKVYLYETVSSGGCGGIVGMFVCDEFIRAASAKDLCKMACVTAEELDAYKKGGDVSCWSTSSPTRFEQPLTLASFRKANGTPINRAPQTWMYIQKI